MTLAQHLEALRPRTAELDALDSQIGCFIAGVEEQLRACLSTRIRLELGPGEALCFGKRDGDWCLIVETKGKQTPLASCSREWRSRVFREQLIEQLVMSAASQLDAQIAERREAIARAAALIQAFENASSPERKEDAIARAQG